MTTRDTRGRFDAMLAAEGADVIHVPLIEIADPPAGDDEFEEALDRLAAFDWLLVTSQHGAERVGRRAALHPTVRLGAVGTRTADVLSGLAGRPVDVQPERQTAVHLAAAMPDPGERNTVLIAQADRAGPTLADDLRRRGYSVETATAYRTVLRAPTPPERHAALSADAVAFASGSAVRAWVEAFGTVSPPVVISIGPTTSGVAAELGLQVTHEAADHDLDGLVHESIAALSPGS